MEATRGCALSSDPAAIRLCQIRVISSLGSSRSRGGRSTACSHARTTVSLQWWLWGEAGARTGSSFSRCVTPGGGRSKASTASTSIPDLGRKVSEPYVIDGAYEFALSVGAPQFVNREDVAM